jgi:CheY-like chemotaxis protein
MTKILLVEDDKSLREIYGVRLLAEGYDIVSAGDGEEALAMAIKERPELIISDVMMPKISGFDMLDILRSTTETRDIRVIMMTALSSDDQRARGEQLGADRYLVKSQVGIEDVVHTVHEVLADADKIVPSATAPAAATEDADSTAPASAPAPTMTPAPSDSQQSSSLPQPTAPFSSPHPDNLGERVINPLPSNAPEPTVGSKIEDELAAAAPDSPNPFDTPAAEPTTPSEEPAQSAPVPEPTTVSADDVVPDPAVTQVENSEASEEDIASADDTPKQQPVA